MGGSNCKSFSPKSSGKIKPSESGSDMFSDKSNEEDSGNYIRTYELGREFH
jgi:hypothetical protein